MRKIKTRGPNTVMEGVFTSPYAQNGSHGRKLRKPANNGKRVRRHVQAKPVAILLALLVSVSAFAASPGAPADSSEGQPAEAVGEAMEQQRLTDKMPADSRYASTKRVYLEDYERIHEISNKSYPTKTYVLGQQKRPEGTNDSGK